MTEETIFAAAVDKTDPAERAAFLEDACAGDADLRRRVEGLLAAHQQAGSFLGKPAIAPDTDHASTHAFDGGGPPATRDEGAAGPHADTDLSFLAPAGRPDSIGRLGHYEILQVLGKGGFGIVFRAFDTVLQRVVAVKVLAPLMAATSPARKRFIREAQSSAKISHENVVRVHAVEEQPLPYLVMEFIPGESLQDKLDRMGPLDVPEVLRIGRQVAEGLAAAHDQELIHRDIKPGNVLIEAGAAHRAKITDFGLARAADDASISQSGIVAGTPMYMAPEQAKGETLDHRADLFSLGSVLYAMLTGRPPFRANNTLAVLKRVAEDTPRPIREIIPEVPEWLCRVVEKLHAKDPAQRYQSAREVADVLADCGAQLKAHGALRDFSRIPGGGRSARGRRSRRWEWVAGAVVVLAGLAVWFGRPAALYFSNRGELELHPENGLVSVIVLHNDEGVIDGNKLHAAATDWLDMKRSHTLKLPPGRYQLNVGTWPEGTSVSQWHVTTSGPFGTHTMLVPVVNTSAIVTVDRGHRVTLRAKMRTNPPRPPLPPPADDKSRLQGRWRLVAVERLGRAVPVADLQSVDWIEFEGDRQTTYWNGRTWPGNFTLDTTVEPRQLTLTSSEFEPVRCIYHFDGDKLVMAQSLPGQPRPLAFATSPDTRFAVATYVRDTRPPGPATDPAVVQALRDAVAAKERSRDVMRTRFDARVANKLELLAAEVELTEARIDLAAARHEPAEVAARLQDLVSQRQEERDQTAIRVEAGRDAANALDRADARLAEAKARLAKAGPPPKP